MGLAPSRAVRGILETEHIRRQILSILLLNGFRITQVLRLARVEI
jgi:hypothetical protein